ncbi:hypothetical protein ACFO3H_22660, partial [Halorussus sp. GCM10023401]
MFSHDATPYDWVGAWSEKRAQLTPDAVGLVDATTGERYTYAELDRRANRTARLLRAEGVALDDPAEGASASGNDAVSAGENDGVSVSGMDRDAAAGGR